MTGLTMGPPPDTEADYGPGGHRYNDDLLLGEAARDRARREHPAAFHILNWESLRKTFRPVNDSANDAKKQSHVAGFWAVAAAFLALAGASGEPLWSTLPEPWPRAIVIASGALGVLAFAIAGLGLVYGTHKQMWLWDRLHTEQLRQMHFQAFVWQLPEIAASLAPGASRDVFEATRANWLSRLEDDFANKDTGRLSGLLDPAKKAPIWAVPSAEHHAEPIVPHDVDLGELFRAYEVFRFDEQEGYVEHMLRRRNRPAQRRKSRRPPWRWYPGIDLPLRLKRRVFNGVWMVGITVLVLMHVAILVASATGSHALQGAWPHVVVLVAALLAVAVKTLGEGFALTRELERYEEYRAAVSDLHRAFRSAKTPREKVRVMMEMEKTAFEEMRVFLRSHSEATFIL